MTAAPVRVHTENLDVSPAKTPVDDMTGSGHNQSAPKQPLRALHLNTTEQGKPMTQQQKKALIALSVVAIAAGVGTGFGAHKLQLKATNGSPAATQQVAGDTVSAGDVFGVKDDQTFRDSAEGYLAAGGVDGEGSHSLLREGGPSQTVYLTSSITDLDKLVGMKVKVWGETFKGQKAGWLMDVGRIQVIETNAQPPADAEE